MWSYNDGDVFCLTDGAGGVTSPPRALSCPDKEKIAMDISALTKQYRKLRERQKQAHVILTGKHNLQSFSSIFFFRRKSSEYKHLDTVKVVLYA